MARSRKEIARGALSVNGDKCAAILTHTQHLGWLLNQLSDFLQCGIQAYLAN